MVGGLSRRRGATFPFSPVGRRWPEGSDQGACATLTVSATPSSRCRDRLPAGEKGQEAQTRAIEDGFEKKVSRGGFIAELRP
ncbi:hypothetical protein B5M44_21695 [Shinella sumterensis]|nr:hypothetical protein B5M44_21695 [Shinella sumterensis]